MGGEATSAGGGGFRARMDHYLYSGEKKHVLAGIAIFAAIFGVPWYFMSRGWDGFIQATKRMDGFFLEPSHTCTTWYRQPNAPLDSQSGKRIELAKCLVVEKGTKHQSHQDYMERANKARSERLSSGQSSSLKE